MLHFACIMVVIEPKNKNSLEDLDSFESANPWASLHVCCMHAQPVDLDSLESANLWVVSACVLYACTTRAPK